MAKVDDTSEAGQQEPKSYLLADFGETGSATFVVRQNNITSGQIAALVAHLELLVQMDMTQQILSQVQDPGVDPPKLWKPGNTR